MLCLTRLEGEAIRIGDAYVTVLSLGNGRVKLGIDAPREITVMRCELESAGAGRTAAVTDDTPHGPRRTPK